MSQITFGRGCYSILYVDLQSSQELGILDTDYIEDYYGNDGQLTLVNLADLTEYDLPMSQVGVTHITPETPHDYFRGAIALESLPNATYSVRGRVRNTLGLYAILSAYSAPIGTEILHEMQITISGVKPGPNNAVNTGPLVLRGGSEVDVARILYDIAAIRNDPDPIEVARKFESC